ncbi:MAG: hypothetical protein HQ485_08965 [Acidobacteria bacterium]|nr:hypothetical protein [Acidobacteriota bacterium]
MAGAAGCGDRAEPDDAVSDSVALPDSAQPSPDWLDGDAIGDEPLMFAVLAGHWTVREDEGGRVLRVDGSEWVVGTEPARLDDKAAVLFSSTPEAFAGRVRQGLKFPYGVVPSAGEFSDGDMQVDFRLVGGESDQYASLLFGLGADANHYAFRYNTKDGDTAVWRVIDGERERVHHGGVHVEVPLGEWRTLRLRIDGTELTGWVDDLQTLTYTLPGPIRGRVGLWSKADSITDYRRFSATARQ